MARRKNPVFRRALVEPILTQAFSCSLLAETTLSTRRLNLNKCLVQDSPATEYEIQDRIRCQRSLLRIGRNGTFNPSR